jgi:hypothetical protein
VGWFVFVPGGAGWQAAMAKAATQSSAARLCLPFGSLLIIYFSEAVV